MCKEKTLFNGMCDSTHKCAGSGGNVHAFCSEPHEDMRDPLNAMSEIEGYGSVNYCTRCYIDKKKEDAYLDSDEIILERHHKKATNKRKGGTTKANGTALAKKSNTGLLCLRIIRLFCLRKWKKLTQSRY
jgi:hypothetical protein